MKLEITLLLGTLAGLFQFLGYIYYLRIKSIEPEPLTWFMFAYGTAILTILEWDSKAVSAELILPVVCSLLAIYVSWKCWKSARISDPSKWWPEDWWPEDKWERYSLVSDLFITIGYISIWTFTASVILSDIGHGYAVFFFLVLSNISTFPSFYPLIKRAYLYPEKEHSLPWTLWAIAYTILAVLTFMLHGIFFHILMFYPVSNALLHGAVAVVARPQRKKAVEA